MSLALRGGVKFPGKECYVTLEWPQRQIDDLVHSIRYVVRWSFIMGWILGSPYFNWLQLFHAFSVIFTSGTSLYGLIHQSTSDSKWTFTTLPLNIFYILQKIAILSFLIIVHNIILLQNLKMSSLLVWVSPILMRRVEQKYSDNIWRHSLNT